MLRLTSDRLRAALGVVDPVRPTTVALVAHVCHWSQADALRALSMLHVQGFVRAITHVSSDGHGGPVYIRTDKPETEVLGVEHAK